MGYWIVLVILACALFAVIAFYVGDADEDEVNEGINDGRDSSLRSE